MRKLLMLFVFFTFGTIAMQAQTTKCGMTLEECKKVCTTNPDCSKVPNCSPAACAKVAKGEKETTVPTAVLTGITTKTSCQKAAKSCCAKMAKKTETPKTESAAIQVALNKE